MNVDAAMVVIAMTVAVEMASAIVPIVAIVIEVASIMEVTEQKNLIAPGCIHSCYIFNELGDNRMCSQFQLLN